MIHLFLDSNIYLNFYHFSDEDLDRLEDLRKLIEESKQIKLWVSSQVVDEFQRNRETKIRDALKQFQESAVTLRLPNMCTGYGEVETLKRVSREFADAKKKVLKSLNEDINNQRLKADTAINRLLTSNMINIDTELLTTAKLRYDRGNPPGKNKSYGDAINWEFLLTNVPTNEDIFFISVDKDFASPLDEKNFSLFLMNEWKSKKGSEVHYFTSLRSFFRERFPDIELIDEYIKEQEIAAFARSGNFDQARAHINNLLRIADFSDSQAEAIIKASLSNDQIYNAHIYSPDIVGKRLERIVSGHEMKVDQELYRRFCSQFGLPDPYEWDSPF